MNPPKRWIEDKVESTPLERAILRPALTVAIRSGAEQRVWTKLMAAAPLTAVALTASSAAGTSAGTAAVEGGAGAATAIGAGAKLGLTAVGKALAIGVASGALFAGGASLVLEPSSPQTPPSSAMEKMGAETVAPQRSSSKSEALAVPAPAAPAESELQALPRSAAREAPRESRPVESARPPAPSVTSFPSLSPAPSPSSRLREEAAVLRRAREALRQGNLSGAFAELEVARTAFPRGALGEEREALTIELLARSGQSNAAKLRAQAFLRSFPRSHYADNVRKFVE